MRSDFDQYLEPTVLIDSDHPAIIAFTKLHQGEEVDPVKQIVKIYYAVRDDIIYDPYHVDLSEHAMKASTLVERGRGFCVEKSNLLAACARGLNIPSRIGLADVKNHVGSDKLIEILKSDIFACHGYTELFLNERWVKATPAFNKALCDMLNVDPLEFNGADDSIFQEYDVAGEKRFMEYLYDHGTFADVPREYIIQVLYKHYPHVFDDAKSELISGSFFTT